MDNYDTKTEPASLKGFKTEVMDLSSIGRVKMPSKEDLNSTQILHDTHELEPSFFVFSHDEIQQYKISPAQYLFKIGKSTNCDITIDDNSVSSEQVSVVLLGDTCYFMDCGLHDNVYFNGINERQAYIPIEGRMVMRVGNTWIVYIGIDSHNYADMGDTMLVKKALQLGEDLGKNPQGEVVIDSLFGEWLTHSSPILIGSHSSCDYKLNGDNVKPFHALIYFSPNGVFIEDLTHGFPGIRVQDIKTLGLCPVHEDMIVQIDETPISLQVFGDLGLRCDFLFHDLNLKPGLALTQLDCQVPNSISLNFGAALTVGRSSECNIIIDDLSVSKRHATLIVENKYVKLADTASKNCTYVNMEEITKATLHPGDIIQFGETFFLMHYE